MNSPAAMRASKRSSRCRSSAERTGLRASGSLPCVSMAWVYIRSRSWSSTDRSVDDRTFGYPCASGAVGWRPGCQRPESRIRGTDPMKKDTPSKTAWRVALARAAHQVIDPAPRVFDDPIALRIVGEAHAQALRSGRGRHGATYARRMRAFVVARSRIAEDELAAAVARGVRQYVVLGAGLDTFAWRNPHAAAGLRVFEVDHPATQAWKRRLVAAAGLPVEGCAAFVPVEFETQSWLGALLSAGFRPDVPTHFAWLGVTMYLSRAQI